MSRFDDVFIAEQQVKQASGVCALLECIARSAQSTSGTTRVALKIGDAVGVCSIGFDTTTSQACSLCLTPRCGLVRHHSQTSRLILFRVHARRVFARARFGPAVGCNAGEAEAVASDAR